jgi:hypothetical protein
MLVERLDHDSIRLVEAVISVKKNEDALQSKDGKF